MSRRHVASVAGLDYPRTAGSGSLGAASHSGSRASSPSGARGRRATPRWRPARRRPSRCRGARREGANAGGTGRAKPAVPRGVAFAFAGLTVPPGRSKGVARAGRPAWSGRDRIDERAAYREVRGGPTTPKDGRFGRWRAMWVTYSRWHSASPQKSSGSWLYVPRVTSGTRSDPGYVSALAPAPQQRSRLEMASAGVSSTLERVLTSERTLSA